MRINKSYFHSSETTCGEFFSSSNHIGRLKVGLVKENFSVQKHVYSRICDIIRTLPCRHGVVNYLNASNLLGNYGLKFCEYLSKISSKTVVLLLWLSFYA